MSAPISPSPATVLALADMNGWVTINLETAVPHKTVKLPEAGDTTVVLISPALRLCTGLAMVGSYVALNAVVSGSLRCGGRHDLEEWDGAGTPTMERLFRGRSYGVIRKLAENVCMITLSLGNGPTGTVEWGYSAAPETMSMEELERVVNGIGEVTFTDLENQVKDDTAMATDAAAGLGFVVTHLSHPPHEPKMADGIKHAIAMIRSLGVSEATYTHDDTAGGGDLYLATVARTVTVDGIPIPVPQSIARKA